MRFERRVMRPLARVEIDVPSARTSIAAIRRRSALALPAAGPVVRARDNVVLLASAPHGVSEQKSDSCASFARTRALPLLPSIPCPLRQSLKATVVVPFALSSVVLGKTMSRRLRNLRCSLQALRKQNYRVIVFMIERECSLCNTPEARCCNVYVCTISETAGKDAQARGNAPEGAGAFRDDKCIRLRRDAAKFREM